MSLCTWQASQASYRDLKMLAQIGQRLEQATVGIANVVKPRNNER